MKLEFRDLKADEIECRVQSVKENGLILLLYKDARCDMNMLDEVVGAMNWKREHTRDNANCIVSIYDEDKKQWVSKEDTGTESYTEAAKGLASDSFKRACFNWGIGRELYTAPFIWVSAACAEIKKDNKGRLYCNDTFEVTDIVIESKQITKLQIYNTKKKCNAYKYTKSPLLNKENNTETAPIEQTEPEPYACEDCGTPFKDMTINEQLVTAEKQYMMAIQSRGRAICKKCFDKAKAGT